MKVLMLGWELPPHNSGGLGTACYQLCKSLAKQNVSIEFVLPYEADHGIDFMEITAAQPQGVASIVRSGIAYDSYKYTLADGTEEWFGIYDQQQLYEQAVAEIIQGKEFDIVHAHDWLTFGPLCASSKSRAFRSFCTSIRSIRSGRQPARQSAGA